MIPCSKLVLFLSLSLLDHFVNGVRPKTKIEPFVFGIIGETLCSFAKREMLIGTLQLRGWCPRETKCCCTRADFKVLENTRLST